MIHVVFALYCNELAIMMPLNACIISLIVYIQPLLAAAPDSLEPTVQ